MWPYVNESMLVDSEVYSDLNPYSAPQWTARIITSNKIPCLLSEYLFEFINICHNKLTLQQILGSAYNLDFDQGKIILLYLNNQF